MKFTIEINLGVKEGTNYCSFEVEDIDSDELISVLNEIEDGIVALLDSKFNMEDKPDD